MYFLYKPNTEAEQQRSENKEKHSLVGLAPAVNFINLKCVRVFRTNVILAAFFTYIGTYILRKKLPKRCSYEKRILQTDFMCAGLNFTNLFTQLRSAFVLIDPESVKRLMT